MTLELLDSYKVSDQFGMTAGNTFTFKVAGVNSAETISTAKYDAYEGKTATFNLMDNVRGDIGDTSSIAGWRVEHKIIDLAGNVVENVPADLNAIFDLDKAGNLNVLGDKAAFLPDGWQLISTFFYTTLDQFGMKSANEGVATVTLHGADSTTFAEVVDFNVLEVSSIDRLDLNKFARDADFNSIIQTKVLDVSYQYIDAKGDIYKEIPGSTEGFITMNSDGTLATHGDAIAWLPEGSKLSAFIKFSAIDTAAAGAKEAYGMVTMNVLGMNSQDGFKDTVIPTLEGQMVKGNLLKMADATDMGDTFSVYSIEGQKVIWGSSGKIDTLESFKKIAGYFADNATLPDGFAEVNELLQSLDTKAMVEKLGATLRSASEIINYLNGFGIKIGQNAMEGLTKIAAKIDAAAGGSTGEDFLTFKLQSGAIVHLWQNGDFTFDSNGTDTHLAAGAMGKDSFAVELVDQGGIVSRAGSVMIETTGLNTNPTFAAAEIRTQEGVTLEGALAVKEFDDGDAAMFASATVATKLLDMKLMIETGYHDLAMLREDYAKRSEGLSTKMKYYQAVVAKDQAVLDEVMKKYTEAAQPLNDDIMKLNEQIAIYNQKLTDAGYYKQVAELAAKYDPQIADLNKLIAEATANQKWDAVKEYQAKLDAVNAEFTKIAGSIKGQYAEIFDAIAKLTDMVLGDHTQLDKLYQEIVGKAEAVYNADIAVIDSLRHDMAALKAEFSAAALPIREYINTLSNAGETVDFLAGQKIIFLVGATLVYDKFGGYISDTLNMHEVAAGDQFAASMKVNFVDGFDGSAANKVTYIADGVDDAIVFKGAHADLWEGKTADGNLGAFDPDKVNGVNESAVLDSVTVNDTLVDAKRYIETFNAELKTVEEVFAERTIRLSGVQSNGHVVAARLALDTFTKDYADLAAKDMAGINDASNLILGITDKLASGGYYSGLERIDAAYAPKLAEIQSLIDKAAAEGDLNLVEFYTSQFVSLQSERIKVVTEFSAPFADSLRMLEDANMRLDFFKSDLAALDKTLAGYEMAYSDAVAAVEKISAEITALEANYKTDVAAIYDKIADFSNADGHVTFSVGAAGANITFANDVIGTFTEKGDFVFDASKSLSMSLGETSQLDMTATFVDHLGNKTSGNVTVDMFATNEAPNAGVVSFAALEGRTSGYISDLLTNTFDKDVHDTLSVTAINGVAVTPDALAAIQDQIITTEHQAPTLIEQYVKLVNGIFNILYNGNSVLNQEQMLLAQEYQAQIIHTLEKMAFEMGDVNGMSIADQLVRFNDLGGVQYVNNQQALLFTDLVLPDSIKAAEQKWISNFHLQDTYTTTEIIPGHLDIPLDGGNLEMTSNGRWTLVVWPGQDGIVPHHAKFEFTVADNNGAMATGIATVDNNNVQVDRNDFISTALGETARFSLHSNDFDANGDPLVLTSINDQAFVDSAAWAPTHEKSYVEYDSSLFRHAALVSADTYTSSPDTYSAERSYIPLGEGDMVTTTDRAATNIFTLASGIMVTVGADGNGFVDTSAFAARLTEWVVTFPTKAVYLVPYDVSADGTIIDPALSELRTGTDWVITMPTKYDYAAFFSQMGLQWDAVANTVTDSFTYKNADGFGGEAGATANITIDISSLMTPTYHDYITPTYTDLTLEQSLMSQLEATDTWTS
jgi:hypothetical protein